jgi:hypothetical protein
MKRKLVEAEKSAPEIAQEAVERVRALYAVERLAKELSAEKRLELRRQHSAPLLAELHDRLVEWKQQLLPKHPMAEAINYALGQWQELSVFLSDGAVPIDNNVSTAARGSAHVMPTAGLCRIVDAGYGLA